MAGYFQTDFLTLDCIYSIYLTKRGTFQSDNICDWKWPFAAVSHTNQHFKEGNYTATPTVEVITFRLIAVNTQITLHLYRTL